ncbi:MAG: RdgB/HAM1 family non-canonical purine NTP pyrophosphatase [Actinobacteria bacterium]|jgi:XTP/dITP diphosphohydrolase|nr:RdgB/HAM1 family non-canonical purine NTP pyrophosphatase [Actinomycetota bacterium]
MPPQVVLASKNRHKLQELHRILESHGLDVELLGADAFPDLPDIAETESSFAGNALLKAREIARITGLPAIADDSGLCINALNGMPGIFSARWSGNHGDDAGNVALVLAQIDDVPDARRGAAFHCAAAIALPDGTERVVEGTVEGAIIREPRGTGGFGYDPIFIPLGKSRTLAEIPASEKDAISHRGRALEALAPVIAALLD